MKKDHIYNILIILFAIAVFASIGFIVKKDLNKVEDHLTQCKKLCYPATVAEQFSKRHCVCQPIIKSNSELDEE